MKKRILISIFLMVVTLFAAYPAVFATDDGEVEMKESDPRYTEFYGKIIGTILGGISETLIPNIFNGVVVYYSNPTAAIEDIRRGRIDGFMHDLTILENIVTAPGNEDLEIVEVPAEIFIAPIGAVSNDLKLIGRFNAFLSDIEIDGTLKDMQDRWMFASPGFEPSMADLWLTGENGVLRVATTTQRGLDVELVLLFAKREGLLVEFTEVDFTALIPHVLSGHADMAIANISITEERKESISFTYPLYYDQYGILTLKLDAAGNAAKREAGLFERLKIAVERNLLIDGRWKIIANGLGVTMVIALSAQALGTIFGCFLCFMLIRGNKFAVWLVNCYCGMIYGTPRVVLLLVTYYIIFSDMDVSNILVAILAFTMMCAAEVGQKLKSAIDTVARVEIEAARSLGFTAFGAFTMVTLPQAVRRVLSGYSNDFVKLVKATAIVGYIAIVDLARAGDIIRGRTYDAYFPILFVALIYLTFTTILAKLIKYTVNKINRGVMP